MSEDLRRRVRDLRALAGEHLPGGGPAIATFGAVACDRCGHVEALTEPEAASGVLGERFNAWRRGPEGDICPSCAASDDSGGGGDPA